MIWVHIVCNIVYLRDEQLTLFSNGAKVVYYVFSIGTMLRILLSFSIYTNATKILSTNQPAGTLSAVNGIRFVSMTWVILGHVYAFGLSSGGRSSSFNSSYEFINP